MLRVLVFAAVVATTALLCSIHRCFASTVAAAAAAVIPEAPKYCRYSGVGPPTTTSSTITRIYATIAFFITPTIMITSTLTTIIIVIGNAIIATVTTVAATPTLTLPTTTTTTTTTHAVGIAPLHGARSCRRNSRDGACLQCTPRCAQQQRLLPVRANSAIVMLLLLLATAGVLCLWKCGPRACQARHRLALNSAPFSFGTEAEDFDAEDLSEAQVRVCVAERCGDQRIKCAVAWHLACTQDTV